MLYYTLLYKEETMAKILRLPQVAEMFGLSEATIMRKVKNGTFPKAKKLGDRAIGWLLSDLEAHIKHLEEN